MVAVDGGELVRVHHDLHAVDEPARRPRPPPRTTGAPPMRTTMPGEPFTERRSMVASAGMRPARLTMSRLTRCGPDHGSAGGVVVGAAVAQQHDVGSEQRHHRVDVAQRGGGQEGLGHPELVGVADRAGRRGGVAQLAPGPDRLLAHGRLALAEDRRPPTRTARRTRRPTAPSAARWARAPRAAAGTPSSASRPARRGRPGLLRPRSDVGSRRSTGSASGAARTSGSGSHGPT